MSYEQVCEDNGRRMFAGAIRRVLAGWRKSAPPWLGKRRQIEKNADWRACHCVLIDFALPWEHAENARHVKWKAGRSLFSAPFIEGVDL